MPVRIDTSQPTQSTATTSQPPSQQTTPPIGISSQATTITPKPARCCSCTPFFKKIGDCFRSIGNFFRSGCVTVLETIGRLINYLTSCVRGAPNPRGPSSNEWMLPSDIVRTLQVTPPEPAVQTPIQLPGPPQVTPPNPTVQLPPQPPGPARATPIEPTVNAPLTPPPAADPFSSLPITMEEMDKIHDIVDTLGTTGFFSLWRQRPALERLGREIEHVHPLKFLEYILLHNTLPTHLDTIRNTPWVWDEFLKGLSGKLERERAGLPAYIPGFSRSMQIDPARFERYLSSGNWQDMVFFLLDVRLGRIILPPPPPMPPAPLATHAPAPQPNPSQSGASPATHTPAPPSTPSRLGALPTTQAPIPPSTPSRPGALPTTQAPIPPSTPSRPGASPATQAPAPPSTPSRPGASPATQAPAQQPTPSRPGAPPATPTRSVASLQLRPSRILQRSLQSLRSSTAINIQSPQRPPAPTLTAWQQIALSDPQKEVVAQIIETHQNMGYYSALRGDQNVTSLWNRLKQDQIHPLALLAHLFTTPEYVAKLDSLWTYRMHRRYFVSELATFLGQRPESDYLPHTADFCRAVQKKELDITAHIHFQKWWELIELLNRSKPVPLT